MWTREQLKNSAKDVLRRNYWMPFLASLLYGIMVGLVGGGSGSSLPSFKFTFSAEELQNSEMWMLLEEWLDKIDPAQVFSFLALGGMAVVLIWLVGLVISLALQCFVRGPLLVGHERYYIANREKEARIDELFYSFKKNYMKVALAHFTTTLLISLGSLVIVPGIIFTYKWFHVGRILAESPTLTGKRAREISDAMTDGEKLEIFVLQLSFIGWYLLGALCCGVGTVFVTPYEQATYAELYAVQRQRVLDAGLATAEELPGV